MATEKQKKAFENLVENGGNKHKAIKDANYSDAMAKTPKKVTESKGWKELVDEHLPEKDLVKVHKEGLRATIKRPHVIERDDKGKPIYEYVREDDYQTRHKYLDTAYKVRGNYAPEKQTMKVDVTIQETLAKKYEAKDNTIRSTGGNS